MADEDNTIKKTVQIDLEVDTTHTDSSQNPFMKIIHMAKAIDAWRIFPRLFITVYIYLLYETVTWFMALPTPTTEQSALVSVVTGIGAAWFGLYLGSGKNKD